jgi:hypothetical protein
MCDYVIEKKEKEGVCYCIIIRLDLNIFYYVNIHHNMKQSLLYLHYTSTTIHGNIYAQGLTIWGYNAKNG